MKKSIIAACVFIVALSACNTSNKSKNAQVSKTEVADQAHNSRNSLDWAGVYKGSLPCADCEGIAVEIRLDSDQSYERVMTYLGKEDGRVSDRGEFEWDEKGGKIRLINETKSDDNWFQVGENKLFLLDTEGNRIESTIPSENYTLEKIDGDHIIVEKYWKLTMLNGKEIVFAEEQDREAYFILKKEDNRVTGSTGCNNLNGGYTLSEVDRTLTFTPMATTRMACIGVDYESDYLKLFEACDSYSIENDVLTLRKGDSSLAEFTAVYLR